LTKKLGKNPSIIGIVGIGTGESNLVPWVMIPNPNNGSKKLLDYKEE
jgi:hypothetical protein